MAAIPQRRRDALAALAALAAIAVIIMVLRTVQQHPNPAISALLLLLVVLATATAAQLRVAIGISIAATLGFNFFLLKPFNTLNIAEPQEWTALLVFVTVAIIGSQLAEMVRRQTRLSQRASLASALLASFSHDLRTPVTSVRLAVSNLQDVTLSPEERTAQAQLAVQELDRLTRVLQNILEMARIDAAAVNPEKQWVSPADVVDAAVAHAGPALAARELAIDADSAREVEIDPRLTSTALAHVLENAARYSPADAPIAIDATVDAGGARFVVTDRGPGFEAADLTHLFEPFYRGRKTKHAQGTGLGLAITRGLLAAEGGRIWCENVPAGGAQFTIRVPASVRATDAGVT
jgi:two-component system sensor histidine kinase KdpD